MTPSAPARVLFACVHNAGRSQMAAALFNAAADPARAQALSAGTCPGTQVHPVVVASMRELGMDLTQSRPQLLTDALASGATMLITMGCGDACPHVPGVVRDDWPLDDPKDRTAAQVRAIRDDIARRVSALLERRGWQAASGPAS